VKASNEGGTVTVVINSSPPISVTVRNALAVPEEISGTGTAARFTGKSKAAWN